MWHRAETGRAAHLDRLLHDLERRLAGLSRTVYAPRAAPAVDRVSDSFSAAFNDVADKFRGRARAVVGDASHLSEDALKFGNDALRKLTREVEHRPLMMLAIAVGVGALATALLTRR